MSIRVNVSYPNELSGLYGWWDANDLKALADDSDVDSWQDKSGNGFHLVWENYNSVSVKSKKQTNSNGNTILNGRGIYKTSSMLLGASQPITFFIVFKSNQINNNAIFGTPQDATAFGLLSSNNFVMFYGSASNTVATPADTTTYHQMSSVLSTTTSQRLLRFDQSNKAVLANNNTGITDLWLNTRPVGFGGNGSNAHCEIIVYNRALALQEIQRVERYLKFKWSM